MSLVCVARKLICVRDYTVEKSSASGPASVFGSCSGGMLWKEVCKYFKGSNILAKIEPTLHPIVIKAKQCGRQKDAKYKY